MDYQTYYDRSHAGAKLVEDGDLDGGIRIFEELVDSDLADVDKAIMCLNLAKIYEKKYETKMALRWLDRGMDIERKYSRSNVAEHKALFLIQNNQKSDALKIYREFVKKPFVSEEQRARFLNNLQVLEAELKS